MRITTRLLLVVLLLSAQQHSIRAAEAVSLFDGKTLEGWDFDSKWWRVKDGMIEGGSLTEKIPANYFISTKRSFQNFELKLKIKCGGDPATGFINSGIQVRSVRVPGGTHMSGYQVDCGKGWFGKIYDEYRRNRVIAEPVDAAALDKVVDVYGWNEYRIRAEGPRIRVWINGTLATDFTETDKNIALDGQIGPQVHSGGACLVQFKDVTVEELPPTPGVPTWESLGGFKPPPAKAKAKAKTEAAVPANKVAAQMSIDAGPRTPEDERKAFTLPDGFEAELVVSEQEGIGKFIAVAFDTQGRLWTMTAHEYPVDANENRAASDALFAKGGRDKVLVYDNIYGAPSSAKPRIFADNLVMPLGILPYKDGVFVQYGADIRFYRDTDGDGRADKFDVILTGFGTQDSHLFPHQFTRTPGGHILTAQGLFNYSKVVRPDGKPFADGSKEIPFNQCKLARFTPDGSMFESLTSGPNNIWGLTVSREGETWVQEANDIGQPIIPFEPGAYYRTGSKDRLRPYQPPMPATLDPPQMGGTGLSGLALADDKYGWPAPWGIKGASENTPRSFYLANPITSRLNHIKATPENGRYRYEKLPDFLVSADPWFRPVAMQFGPDGCLYIVDWYNKIISHNEVPRAHPDRDKTRGRIWRIRHKDQPRTAPINLAKLSDQQLLAQLGAPNARIADLAWQEIVDRKATGLEGGLKEIISDKASPADRRLGALWALEGISKVTSDLLSKLAQDANANLRHEAVRVAALHLPPSDFVTLASPLVDDSSPRVRAALGDALRRIAKPSASVIAIAARLGKAPLTGDVWAAYDREFERYLARWAMELHPQAVAAFLNSAEGKALPLENRLLATLSLGGKESAIGLAKLMPELQRPLGDEEVRTLAANFSEPAVGDALKHALSLTGSRASTLRALLNLRTSLDTTPLAAALTDAAHTLLASDQSPDVLLGVEAAGAFQLASLEPDLVRVLQRGMGASRTPPNQPVLQPQSLAALQSLANLRSGQIDLFAKLVDSPDAATRDAAILALASSRNEQGPLKLAGLWPNLPAAARPKVVERLTASKPAAQALLASLKSGQIPRDEIGIPALERMHTLLAGDAAMEDLWRELAGRLQRVLRLKGGDQDFVAQSITLTGPFTVEAWVKLAPDISNHDGILGAPGVLDLNFHASQFRVWLGGGQHDVAVAKRKTPPETWTHYAVTRDAQGVFRIYLNGELDATSTQRNTNTFAGLNIGRTNPNAGGTDGWLAEYRIWNVARSAEEIRDNFDRAFAADGRDALPRVQTAATDATRTRSSASLPAGLAQQLSGGDWGKLNGKAAVEATLEAPVLLTAAQAKAQVEKFAQFRSQADKAGNAATGKELFATLCLSCHQQGGKGGQIAPALDGLANTGVEAILRNVLTPNAAMEGGYRKYRVETRDGELLEGLLVTEDKDAIVLRQPNVADQRIPRANVKRAGFTNTSLMPEGLLEGMQPAQVSDLFAYLKSLK